MVLYPKGVDVSKLSYRTTLRLPESWNYGTALPLAHESASGLEFAPVSLETLVDSPLIAGIHFRTVDLTPGANPSHALHMVADSAPALEIKPEDAGHFSHLVAETGALFGARHYRQYHFLLTLSEHVAHFGLEHHQSSDNRVGERFLIDEEARKLSAILLPHEMTHSWNGKYRRPAGLATLDFHQPMKGELLWVYEGLTDYLGVVLAARSGLWTNENAREALALNAARLDYQTGRNWRPLADTTVAAQLLYFARPEGTAWRRSVDFYPEGDLIWLEADVLIRQQTQGRSSLDDFCQRFLGGENGAPKVVPYTLDDVVAGLNGVAPHDWRQFFGDYIVENNVHGIDILNWFLGGHPTKAHGTGGRTAIAYGDNQDHCYVTYDYANNVQGHLIGCMMAPKWYREVKEQFFGENVYVFVSGVAQHGQGSFWSFGPGPTAAAPDS